MSIVVKKETRTDKSWLSISQITDDHVTSSLSPADLTVDTEVVVDRSADAQTHI